ncbi:MAG: TIM barrel protein [Thermoleophilaceae bacterium]
MEQALPAHRVAGAPISWGVCEVPGWGRQLPPARVFAEMTALGLHATELGPIGYLPLDPEELRAYLATFGLHLVGGFVPLVLHDPEMDAARERSRQMAELFAAAGAEVLVAAIVADDDWATPHELSDPEWDRLTAHLAEIDELVADHGLQLAVHPHVGTLIEHDAAVQRLVASTDAGWCLDTGHLVIGGTDPLDFVRRNGARIVHVHLKDVDATLAARVRAGELSLVEATQQGLFRPLGEGDVAIEEILRALDDVGYERWLVLEQDAAITGPEPPDGDGPVLDVARSIEYLTRLAPERGEVAQL